MVASSALADFRRSAVASWGDVRRLLVVRADNIGDVIMAGPALRALKEGLPEAKLTLLASPAGAEAAPLLPWIDEVIRWRVLWQDLGNLPFDTAREWALVRRLRRGRFDGSIIFSSFKQTPHAAAFVACLADIPLRAGSSKVQSGLLTHAIAHGSDADHQVERNLALLEALGFPVADRMLACRAPEEDAARAAALLASHGLRQGEPYLLFNPWASAPARTYPPHRGADAVRRIARATGLPVVLTAHSRDAEATAGLAERIGAGTIDLAGATSVCELSAVVEGAALVVTGNTSVMHMADAASRPTLVLFSGTELESQWAPRGLRHRLLRRPTTCSPCYSIVCPLGLECLDIDPRDVAAAGLELLESNERASLPEKATGSRCLRRPGRRHNLDKVVSSFWQHHMSSGEPSRRDVARLARAALADGGDQPNQATRILFERVVEPLCDAFTETGVKTYRRVFSQIISTARAHKRCETLDRALAEDGILCESDLLDRVPESFLPPQAALGPAERSRIRKVYVLSRLTLGADVAITSSILQRASEVFPGAQISLVGTAGSRVLAESVGNVDLLEVPYFRSDDLASRLNAWPVMRQKLRAASADLRSDEVVVIDTDSRLTQLGLLPSLQGARSYHFPSRSYAAGDPSPLSALVGRWLDETFGGGPLARPLLRLTPQDKAWSRELRAGIGGMEPLVCVSFGIGGNERKRAGITFETDLLEWIVRQGCRVMLARGVGADEVEQTYRITRRLHARGVPVMHFSKGRALPSLDAQARVLTWEADVGAFLAIIACADFYIGYDSAGQHIAAALGTPTLSLFIECAGTRHAERWAPRGSGPTHVVRTAPPVDPVALLDAAREAFLVLSKTTKRKSSGAVRS